MQILSKVLILTSTLGIISDVNAHKKTRFLQDETIKCFKDGNPNHQCAVGDNACQLISGFNRSIPIYLCESITEEKLKELKGKIPKAAS